MTRLAPLCCALALVACGSDASEPVATVSAAPTTPQIPPPASGAVSASAAPASSGPRTPNEFFAGGTPTFVAGTLGTDHEDAVIRSQIEQVRGMLFKNAKIVDDTSIDPKRPDAWPPNTVLYGGPQHNAVVAALAAELPFKMTNDSLQIDGHELSGPGIQLLALVPARTGALAHPTFMLYAGTGPEGVALINSRPHGENSIAVYDPFDSIAAGDWQASEGSLTPRLNWAPKRAALSDESTELKGTRGPAKVTLSTVVGGQYDDLPGKREAVLRGLATALKRLEITAATDVRVVIYPNANAKKAFTHSAGDGHAAAAGRTLHVVAFDAKWLERLVAHEGTHVYTHQVWGAPGTVLLGEGLAVWVAGQYGGTELAAWKKKLTGRTPLATLLGAAFLQMPEQETYPQAGLITAAIVDRIGVPKLRDKVWAATPETWQAACDGVGITTDQLEKATR